VARLIEVTMYLLTSLPSLARTVAVSAAQPIYLRDVFDKSLLKHAQIELELIPRSLWEGLNPDIDLRSLIIELGRERRNLGY
jgi:hypothetical protein